MSTARRVAGAVFDAARNGHLNPDSLIVVSAKRQRGPGEHVLLEMSDGTWITVTVEQHQEEPK